MSIFTTAVPVWASILFLCAIVVPIFSIANLVKQAAQNANFEFSTTQKLRNGIVIFYALFFLYVALMSFTGIFQEVGLPPKILIFTALPLLLFYFLFIFRTKLYWLLLENASLAGLVRVHTFRFVGMFFIIAWFYGALPTYFAWSAGLGDIFAAATAIIVARLIDENHKHYKKITLVWNIVGFWDIVNVLVTAVYVTKQSIATGAQGVNEMANFPFCLIPAFAPATIIFLHISIFKKLKM